MGPAAWVGVQAININLVSSLPTKVRWWWLSVDGPQEVMDRTIGL